MSVQIAIMFIAVIFGIFMYYGLCSHEESAFGLMISTLALMIKSGMYLGLGLIFVVTTPFDNFITDKPELGFLTDLLVIAIAFVESLSLAAEVIKKKAPSYMNENERIWFTMWHLVIILGLGFITWGLYS